MVAPHHPQLSEADRWALLWWRIARSDVRRPLRWAQSLRNAIDVLLSSPTEQAATVFWLRLYAVLHELQRSYAPDEQQNEGEPESTEMDPDEEQAAAQEAHYADLAVDVHAACVSIRGEFTDDELLAIQWKRDDEGHALLTRYDLHEQNGVLRHQRRTIIGIVPFERIHSAVATARAGRSDTAVAIEYATRVSSHVDQLVAAIAAFN